MDTITASSTSEHASERACAAASKAKQLATEALQQGRAALDETLAAAFDCTEQAAIRQPLKTLGIAAGVGVVIGLLIARL